MVENAAEAMLLLRAENDQVDSTILFSNLEAQRLTGYTAVELTGNPVSKLTGPSTDRSILAAYKKAVRQGALARARVLLYRKDGSTFWAELSARRFQPAPGGSGVYIGILRDVDAEMQLRFLVDMCSDMISKHDEDGTFLFVSPSCEELIGYSPHELLGRRSSEFMHPDDLAKLTTFSQLPDVFDLRYRIRCKDGDYKWVESRSEIVRSASDRSRVQEVHAFTRDVTDRVHTERQLRDTMNGYRQLFEANPNPMWIYDPATLAILETNAMASRHYGYSREEFASMTLRDVRSPEETVLLEARVTSGLHGLQDSGIWRHRKQDGTIIDVQVVSSDIEWEGRPARLALLRDVTEVKRSERDLEAYRDRLQRSEHGLASAQAVAHIGSWDFDLVTQQVTWTDELYRIYGLRSEEFPAAVDALWQFDHPSDVDEIKRLCKEARLSRRPYDVVHRIVRKDGVIRWVHEIGKFEYGANDEPIRLVGTLQDITDRKTADDRLEFLAHFDPLTALPNRAMLEHRLGQNMSRALREKTLVAVLFLDLDDFKLVNDSMGHNYGDLLLQRVADALQGGLRETDTVGRYSGDEFVVLVNGLTSLDDVARVAQRAADSISSLIAVEGRDLRASVSIGISLFPDDGRDMETLVKHADVAMYQAKAEGRNLYRFYQPEMQRTVDRRLAIEADLERALQLDQLLLHYQPIVDLASSRIIAAEALIRWQHPERGLLSPIDFVPIAEETGMIVPIGKWVLAKAASDAAAWHKLGINIDVNVNVSPRQFREPDLDHHVVEALRASGLPAERLHLEITESLLMDQAQALDVTLKLKRLGVKIELDDFGTGFSSLGRITDFPIDGLKVDRSFVARLGHEAHFGVITQAIVALAHSLKMTVVAEGIETKDQLATIRQFGCLVGQGYLFSKPVAEPAFRQLFLPEATEKRAG